MSVQEAAVSLLQKVLFYVGIEWAAETHAVCVLDATGRIRAQFTTWTAPAAPRCAERQAAPTSRSPGTGPPGPSPSPGSSPCVPWRVFTPWQILNGLA